MSYILYDPEAPVIQRKRPKRDCTKIVLTDEQQQWLRENFATTYNKDCAAHLGIGLTSVVWWARKLGLTKDPAWMHKITLLHCQEMAEANRGPGNPGKKNLEAGAPFRFRKGQTNRERYGEERERERIRHATVTRNETIRKERQRVRWGLPQQTKLRVISNRKASYVRYDMKRAGYIIPGRCAWVAYYDDATHRIPSLEASAQASGIKVHPVNVVRATGS